MTEALARFGEIEIRPAQRRLLIKGRVATVGARAFDLLLVLIEERHRIVGKNELLARVWPGMVVEESNLPVHVSALRKLLGAEAIATIPGRGYRFTLAADVEGPSATRAAQVTKLTDDPDFTAAAEGMAPVPASVTAPPGRFDSPAAAETLIGREEAVYELVALLIAHRLVDIVGAGGIGKTRLARAVCLRLREDFVDGVWWVDLSPLSRADQVARTVAQVVGEAVAEGTGAAVLAQALARRSRMLLVLDNCEQLAAGLAGWVNSLLAELPQLRILLTSRVPLHVAAEQVWRLDALAVPATGASLAQARRCGAFELFESRARASDRRFVIAETQLPLAIEICQKLQGHALAIEMAAARAPQIGLAALMQRLAERLKFLRASDHTQPARQLSLSATLAWSCSLLDAPQVAVLRRLAVFVGGFGLESAQCVAADGEIDEWAVLDALAALVDHSLVQIDHDDVQAQALAALPPRYRLAETTRLYAVDMLDATHEADAVARRHRLALAQLADRAVDAAWTLTQADFLATFGADEADFQLVFDAAVVDVDAEVAARTGQALAALAAARGLVDASRDRVAAAQGLLAQTSDQRVSALLWNLIAPEAAMTGLGPADLRGAEARAVAWREAGDERQRYRALRHLAAQYAASGHFDQARAAAVEMAAIEDPRWPIALRLEAAQVEADIAAFAGPTEAASAGLRRAIALAGQIGDRHRMAWLQCRLADTATASRQPEQAIGLGLVAVSALEALNRPLMLGLAWRNLCTANLLVGDDAAALRSAAQAYPLLRSQVGSVKLFVDLALLAARGGDAETGARLLGQADRLAATEPESQPRPVDQRLHQLAEAAIEAGLPGLAAAAPGSLPREQAEPLGHAQADELARQVLGQPEWA
jgi:predicted ATPase/DNA-binding winged helix-turn-helix (wHTH) protein